MICIANLKHSTPPIKMLCVSVDDGDTWEYTNIKKFNNSIKDAKLYAKNYISKKEKQNEREFWRRAQEYNKRKYR